MLRNLECYAMTPKGSKISFPSEPNSGYNEQGTIVLVWGLRELMDEKENVIVKALTQSFQNQSFITIRLYGATGDQRLNGLAIKLDQDNRRVKFSHEGGVDWIPFGR